MLACVLLNKNYCLLVSRQVSYYLFGAWIECCHGWKLLLEIFVCSPKNCFPKFGGRCLIVSLTCSLIGTTVGGCDKISILRGLFKNLGYLLIVHYCMFDETCTLRTIFPLALLFQPFVWHWDWITVGGAGLRTLAERRRCCCLCPVRYSAVHLELRISRKAAVFCQGPAASFPSLVTLKETALVFFLQPKI